MAQHDMFFLSMPGGLTQEGRDEALIQAFNTNSTAKAMLEQHTAAMAEPPTVRVLETKGKYIIEVAGYTLEATPRRKGEMHQAACFSCTEEGGVAIVNRNPRDIYGDSQEILNPHYPPKRSDLMVILHEESHYSHKKKNHHFASGCLAHRNWRGKVFMAVMKENNQPYHMRIVKAPTQATAAEPNRPKRKRVSERGVAAHGDPTELLSES